MAGKWEKLALKKTSKEKLPVGRLTVDCQKHNGRYVELGDNCIQIFHLGRYIVGYSVGNFVLRRRVSGVVKHDFRPYIRRYTSPNENFEYGYPHSNVLSTFTHRKHFILCKTLASSAT